MKNLQPPTDDPYIVLDEITNSKREPARRDLQALLPLITQQYSEYEANRYELSVIQAAHLTEYQKEILYKCYDTKTDALNKLKVSILSQQSEYTKGVCQYCTLGEPGTFDHYLPKSIFPEYAILPINLLPCCFMCNERRNNRWIRTSDGGRTTINPYFERIPNVQFLKCRIYFECNIPQAQYFLEKDPAISDSLFAIIETHFEMLDFYKRVQRRVNSEVSEILCSVRGHLEMYRGEKEKIRHLFLMDVAKLAEFYGLNHWRVVLRKALTESEEIFDRFLVEAMPSNV